MADASKHGTNVPIFNCLQCGVVRQSNLMNTNFSIGITKGNDLEICNSRLLFPDHLFLLVDTY